ncbi:unnamed protein product, partial [Hydatigera taeniaeformis]|uniref:Homeobox domain-containing protein n=1 Tax=Hydatigena taeniaeformis TaxID=6205 RepID=A0A0R3WXK5_HYDTA
MRAYAPVTVSALQVWFQNRRAKWKKRKKTSGGGGGGGGSGSGNGGVGGVSCGGSGGGGGGGGGSVNPNVTSAFKTPSLTMNSLARGLESAQNIFVKASQQPSTPPSLSLLHAACSRAAAQLSPDHLGVYNPPPSSSSSNRMSPYSTASMPAGGGGSGASTVYSVPLFVHNYPALRILSDAIMNETISGAYCMEDLTHSVMFKQAMLTSSAHSVGGNPPSSQSRESSSPPPPPPPPLPLPHPHPHSHSHAALHHTWPLSYHNSRPTSVPISAAFQSSIPDSLVT